MIPGEKQLAQGLRAAKTETEVPSPTLPPKQAWDMRSLAQRFGCTDSPDISVLELDLALCLGDLPKVLMKKLCFILGVT